jgi:hypothetical protein
MEIYNHSSLAVTKRYADVIIGTSPGKPVITGVSPIYPNHAARGRGEILGTEVA